MADERCERKGADIIIKTTYDISLDFQDSLLPLGFLSRSRLLPYRLSFRALFVRSSFLSARSSRHTARGGR